jgi:chromate transporter
MPSLDMNDNKLVPPVEGVLLSRLAAYFLHLGTIGFGGPIALVSYMQRDLVEHRQWVWLWLFWEGI